MEFTHKQQEALELLNLPSVKNLMLYGGSQSAKTFFGLFAVLMRALKYPGSVHAICRLKLVELKASIVLTKFPEVAEKSLGKEVANDKDCIHYILSYPSFVELYNGSKIFFVGLEDNRGFEKVLSPSYTTILIDEASEVPYLAFAKLQTRLSQQNEAKKVSIITLNPTTKRHWTYQVFFEKMNPVDRTPLSNGDSYAQLQMNPVDNMVNLPEDYLKTLEGLSSQDRERFLYGRYSDNLAGTVYGKQLTEAMDNGQFVKDLQPVEDSPVYAVFDLGINDAMSVWIVQFTKHKILFLSYYEATGVSILEVFTEFIMSLPYKIAGVYVPHDAENRWVGTGITVVALLRKLSTTMSIESKYPVFWVNKLPKLSVAEGINFARMAFKQCWFDEVKCAEGIEALREYKYERSERLDLYTPKPLHNWASHAADSFRYAVGAYNMVYNIKEKPARDQTKIYFDEVVEGTQSWRG